MINFRPAERVANQAGTRSQPCHGTHELPRPATAASPAVRG